MASNDATRPALKDSPPRPHKEFNPPQPSIPPATATPSGGTNGTRAPDPMALPEAHQVALRRIRALEIQNAKLYEDNCRLINTVNVLNDRLTFVAAPQNIQVLRLADMQEKLRASDDHRELIDRKYQELLQCISAGSGHHHLFAQLQSARDAYTSLDKEYHILRDKYLRLKSVADTSRVAQQHPQGAALALMPAVRSEFRAHDRSVNNSTSPTSVISPASFQPIPDRNGSHRRRSFESVVTQPPLFSGPTSVPTTRPVPLPTPSLPGSQVSPTPVPVHVPIPALSLPTPHRAQMIQRSHISSRLPSAIQPRHEAEIEKLEAALRPPQSCEGATDAVNKVPVQCGQQSSTPMTLESSQTRPLKRPSSEPLASTNAGEERKRSRTEEASVHATTIHADAYSVNKGLPPQAPTDPYHDHKSSESGSDVRSYQDCVNLIFEKDADVENGIFCGLCFDRYQANMIPEPPDVLVQPDFDSLVMHCTTVHPAVWDDLRLKT